MKIINIFRSEHPNPQWKRKKWKNLNGEWEFEFDFGKSAREREVFKGGKLKGKIQVPFCPESDLSGIGYKDFIPAVCYRKVVEFQSEEVKGKNVLLHFGAIDFESFIYVNGIEVFHHIGGYSSFSVDITKYIKIGENSIFVIAEDDTRSVLQPTGKQSQIYESKGCYYTRTTGIWQTVWLEFVPKSYIISAKYVSDIDNSTLYITGDVVGEGTVYANAYFDNREVASTFSDTKNGRFSMTLELSELHLWEIGKGNLYDLNLSFEGDEVESYFGMRNVCLKGKKFLLNGKSVFQRLVLDQGFYKDGIYTAKTDEEFVRDIKISIDAGFNGARLHEKIFEKRFIYHCDKAGYMIWGEYPNWGMDYRDSVACENMINEWLEEIDRDYNSPAIIGWCPFNETWGYGESIEKNRIIETVYKMTKALDPNRICIDTSGVYHVITDIFDIHDYESDPEKFKTYFSDIEDGILYDQVERNSKNNTPLHKYKGEPIFVSEYGGIAWEKEGKNAWGYGNQPKNEDEFFARLKGLTDCLIDNQNIMGFCYTQLYDVEQEQNGLYTYEREPKFDIEKVKKIIGRKAKIED